MPTGSITYKQAIMPSGAQVDVLTDEEADYVTGLSEQYVNQFEFESVADIADLDRIVGMELQVHRINLWLGRRRDYDDNLVDETKLRDSMNRLSLEVRQSKKLLGIDRVAREKASGAGSFPEWLAQLMLAADEFDIHRDEQRDLALELINELIGMVTAHLNMSEDERRELHYTTEDIFDWIRNTLAPEYARLDADFREQKQSTWVREL